jgi:dipeptidase
MKNQAHKKKHRIRFVFPILLALIGFFLVPSSLTRDKLLAFEDLQENCTSIMVGRLASTDGSVITSHSCDGNSRTWLKIIPPQKFAKGSTTKIYNGTRHTETSTDLRGLILKGEVPQVNETYAYLYTSYPCLNEHQLAIGETTIRGRQELVNPEGAFIIDEIERLMLERCTTAREAICLASELVKKYGYGDNGECLTIADPKEVWHFEIFGAGPLETGAVWAAVRIPDDHVGVSANIPRISELVLDDPDLYMASDNVFRIAEKMGWWDPKSGEPFKFWKAYSGRRPFSTREYFIFNTLAPSLKLDINADELPFSVKPDKEVSVRDIMRLYRETYAGTDFDMTKNLMVKDQRSEQLIKSPVANPWMSREMIELFNTLKPGVIERSRPIAVVDCSYSHIIQCRGWLPDPIGGICWFAFDNPGQSARIPIFAGTTELPPSFEVCAQHHFRMDSACWYFRRANRLATVKWGMTREFIEGAIKEFEEKAFAELPLIEKKALELYKAQPQAEGNAIPPCQKFLTQYTNDFARATMQKYLELGDKFWAFFARGF